ncbi:hypothetical protein [Streptomyces microflavus]|uniref:hypothetical protein n=1 Tax=Streptomyces microflavus TaxID=1919 RepID=UPI002E34B7D5|nr:hypothetical protein [Streptomyces microflavus]
MRTRTTITTALTAALLALTGCSSPDPGPVDPKKLDQAGGFACDDFATGFKSALTTTARVNLADKVNKWAQSSATDGISTNGKLLAKGSEMGADAWQVGADAFAQSCLDAGWEA